MLLDQQRGLYFGLNAVAARVWQLLQEPRALTDVEAVLLTEFDVPPHVLAPDLERLAQELRKAGLVSTAS